MAQRNPGFTPPALWAGVECTVNRVGNQFFDQLERSGHAWRLDDLDRFAAVGIQTLRYPILWERVAPHGLQHADWGWVDERLARLRALAIRPIVTLVHHGGGPRGTHLLDPGFAAGLAAFAGAVAARYPWIEDYTPVNEPLTTARFSALYGYWYPHRHDMLACLRALLNETAATAGAMRAIRCRNPAARLVQTEDMGKAFSTPVLAYQAQFENERRWLSLDLLCGRVDEHHPLWGYLQWLGLSDGDLAPFAADPCPPEVIGINHYLTSERFLDERLERYPPDTHGGNGRHAYADVEAVRVRVEGLAGVGGILREAWERYHLPLAVTEVHLGSTREEQLRWLAETWHSALAARRDGVDVRAITAWSLLGAYDWHCLVTRCEDRYEPGVFDIRSPVPRPTALAAVVRDLAAGRDPRHPVLAIPGWWRRPTRLIYPPVPTGRGPDPIPLGAPAAGRAMQPVLIVDRDQSLAIAFARHCAARAIAYRRLPADDLPTMDPGVIDALFAESRPWAVIHPSLAGTDATTASNLAAACVRSGAALLAVSSYRVFDGVRTQRYVESDPVAPRAGQGRRLVQIEAAILGTMPEALIVRAGELLGAPAAVDVVGALRALAVGARVVADDGDRIPYSHVPDLVDVCLDLLIDDERGIVHLAHPGAATAAALIRRVAAFPGLSHGIVVARLRRMSSADGGGGRRQIELASERAWLLPPLADVIAWHSRAWLAAASPATTHERPCPNPGTEPQGTQGRNLRQGRQGAPSAPGVGADAEHAIALDP